MCARTLVCVSVSWCKKMYTGRFYFRLVPFRFVKYQSHRVISISRNGTAPNKKQRQASAQSDQRLCCSLHRQYNTSTCNSRHFKTLASLCGGAGGLSRTWSKPPKTGFLVTCPFIHVSACLCACTLVYLSVCWCMNMYTCTFVIYARSVPFRKIPIPKGD